MARVNAALVNLYEPIVYASTIFQYGAEIVSFSSLTRLARAVRRRVETSALTAPLTLATSISRLYARARLL